MTAATPPPPRDGEVCEAHGNYRCPEARCSPAARPAAPSEPVEPPAETQHRTAAPLVTMPSSGTAPWFFNEPSGALYGPAGPRTRRVVATMLDAEDGYALERAMNAAARPAADTETLRARLVALIGEAKLSRRSGDVNGSMIPRGFVLADDLRAALDGER